MVNKLARDIVVSQVAPMIIKRWEESKLKSACSPYVRKLEHDINRTKGPFVRLLEYRFFYYDPKWLSFVFTLEVLTLIFCVQGVRCISGLFVVQWFGINQPRRHVDNMFTVRFARKPQSNMSNRPSRIALREFLFKSRCDVRLEPSFACSIATGP